MTAPQNAGPQNAVGDLVELTRRNQAAAADAFRSWATAARTIGDAALRGSSAPQHRDWLNSTSWSSQNYLVPQVSSLRRLIRNLFDLADQAVEVERELATFLAVNARVSAATLHSFRTLSDASAAALENAVRATTWTR